MPPELVINRFGGLDTGTDPDDGEITDLSRAENIFYERNGALTNRPGIRFFARGPVCDPSKFSGTQCKTYYCGELRKDDGRVYQLFNAEPTVSPNTGGQFFWNNTLGTGQSSTVSSGSPTAGGINQLFDVAQIKKYGVCKVAGAQYNDNLILPNGLRMRLALTGELILETVTGFPIFFDGWGSMCTHKDRVFAAPKLSAAAGNTPSRLYFSTELTSSTWPADSFLEVGTGQEDGAITCILPFQGRIVILKTGGMWVLETPGAVTSWSLRQYSDKGAVGRAAAVHDTGVFWLGNRGAYKWDGTTFTDIGAPIQDIFDNIGVMDDLDCTAAIYRDRFVVCVMTADGGRRNFIYDINLDQWSELVSPLEQIGYEFVNFFTRDRRPKYISTYTAPNQIVRTEEFGSPGFFFTLKTTGDRAMVYSMLDESPGVDGTLLSIGPPIIQIERPFTSYIHSKFSDLGEAITKKRIHRLAIEFEGPDTTIRQIDEEGRTRDTIINGPDASFVKIGGIGFVRKFAIAITCTYMGLSPFRVKRLFAKVSVNGNQISNQQGQYET